MTTPSSPEVLASRLRACAEDPMWSDHAEVPKQLCVAAASALEECRNLAGYYMAQRDEARAAIAADRAQRVGLTDDGIYAAASRVWGIFDKVSPKKLIEYTRAVEALHGITPPAPTQTPPATAQTQEPKV